MTASIGVVGHGPLLADLRRRAQRLGVDVAVGDPGPGGLTVIEGVAPQPNYLGVCPTSESGRVYCTRASRDYVLALMVEYAVSGATGIRVRPPVAAQWAAVGSPAKQRKRLRRFNPIEFDWDTGESVDADVFDEEVELIADGESGSGRVRLQGHLNPSDGLFHWVGTAYGDDVRRWRDARVRDVEIVARSGAHAHARLTEVTQWGTVRLVGVGAPPS